METQEIVRALDNSPQQMLDLLQDRATGRYFTPYNPMQEQVAKLHAAGIQGQSVTCAYLDTGMLSHHPLLRGKIVDAVDFTGEGPEDLNGHGTVVALIALAIAPQQKVLNVKVLNKDKEGRPKDVASGLEWAAAKGAMVINLSLGIERRTRCDGGCPVCTATRRLVERGVMVVAAAGNRPDRFYCPASSGHAMAVGATDYEGVRKADYSAAAKIYAPGTVLMVPVESR